MCGKRRNTQNIITVTSTWPHGRFFLHFVTNGLFLISVGGVGKGVNSAVHLECDETGPVGDSEEDETGFVGDSDEIGSVEEKEVVKHGFFW